MNSTSTNLNNLLQTWGRLFAGDILSRLNVSRPTLMRAVRELGTQIVTSGRARRTSYASRRAVRGDMKPLTVFRIDAEGRGHRAGELLPLHPEGCLYKASEAPVWPLDDDMQEGWFDGLPYFMDDMRPQGFMGRAFAHSNAKTMKVPDNPNDWSEDDVLYVLSSIGSDQAGDLIIGEDAYRHWQENPAPKIADSDRGIHYPLLSQQAMNQDVEGSSAAGEFPKFTCCVTRNTGDIVHVLVKFSGKDASPGSQRWSDLLICEHLALQTIPSVLGIAAAKSQIFQADGRTFLEVERFDRIGDSGRRAMCTWSALNAGIVGAKPANWPDGMQHLVDYGWLEEEEAENVRVLWHFGKLIGNTDMHDGNLAFFPGLRLAPVYDMLPMFYAPARGVELLDREFKPSKPLPGEEETWTRAKTGAIAFWEAASKESTISETFRQIAKQNLETMMMCH
jgi:hypothetical protein